jgi:hypothetical protein
MRKVLPLYKRRTGKISNHQKHKQVIHAKFVFDELELVMSITTNSRTSHG